ncbi:apolipoprotein N-acyltransferase [Pseudobythopirellula maris]|uniref:Apolipoprotein N-acyltransferase n=1 Tax=Pseudobythopirellula maris TaxID=2527991 RepID=A0A5C5ZK09_9BACT|nr:nitrilase-related carbon-nitrogen hydrolase [Pseudobythopirellula maris]TWT87692.1 apolipoprotein N-acyltransferase [Pseudobythopirellula maris]
MNRIQALFRRSHLWLALGLTMFVLSHGSVTVPICSWFAFVFLIRYHRTSARPWLSILTIWIGMSACYEIVFSGLGVPLSGGLFHTVCLLMAAVGALPFLVDGCFYRKLRGAAATLVWPLTMVTISFFTLAYVPSLADAQVEYPPLIQIVSITGAGGLVFLIYWFAAVLNQIWESGGDWQCVKKEGSLLLGALMLVLAYGETRLALASSQEETLPVAMISEKANSYRDLRTYQLEDLEGLFRLSQEAADEGARVIAWAEGSAETPRGKEEELIERGKEFAKSNEVYLFMSVISHPASGLSENKTVGISPDGQIVVDYLKANLVPGLETHLKKGDGVVAAANIDGVRTGHVICYDIDFPAYIRQAGRSGVDVLFAPSSDWRAIRRFHARPARIRAVENGCSLVRPTIQGLSIATDPYGRVLACQDYFSDGPRLTIVEVPTSGVPTFYASHGDLFSHASIALLAILAGVACLRGSITREPTQTLAQR